MELSVPEVSGRNHATRVASSYPNVGTSGTGTAPRERLREPGSAAASRSDGGSGRVDGARRLSQRGGRPASARRRRSLCT